MQTFIAAQSALNLASSLFSLQSMCSAWIIGTREGHASSSLGITPLATILEGQERVWFNQNCVGRGNQEVGEWISFIVPTFSIIWVLTFPWHFSLSFSLKDFKVAFFHLGRHSNVQSTKPSCTDVLLKYIFCPEQDAPTCKYLCVDQLVGIGCHLVAKWEMSLSHG